MGAGYFNDGMVNIELGAHVFATPSGLRVNVAPEPHDEAARIHDSGGGILELEVTAQRVRANLGDAERYIYEHLHTLATSDPGDLGFEDNRGNRHVFGDSVCAGGLGEVRAFKFADMRLDFLSPEKASEPAWGGVPAAPGAYPGTSALQNYQAGGVTLGVGGTMRIEMMRLYDLRQVPRARGSRTSIPPRGTLLRFIVSADRVADAAPPYGGLATDLENLMRSIGPRPVDLTANGNTYEDVVLESMRPGHTDMKATSVEFEFVKEL